MTTDVNSMRNSSLKLVHDAPSAAERVKSNAAIRLPTRQESSSFNSTKDKRLAMMRGASRRGSLSRSSSYRRQSIKFSKQSFVTKWAGDLEKDYIVGDLLGSGGFGNVYACTQIETGAELAVKEVPKSSYDKENTTVIREFNVLKMLDHPSILKNYALYETDTHFHIVTDRIRGGELYDLIEAGTVFKEDEVRVLMKTLMSTMNYCHQQKVVHRDLKPENILLEEEFDFSHMKVIDFGLAEFFGDDGGKFTERAGSSYYMSPQVIRGKYSSKCDIWSCGIIAFVCLGGYAPFEGANETETAQIIVNSEAVFYDDPVWDNISDDALDFIDFLLTYDEGARPTAAEALQHKWLKSTNEQLSSDDNESMDRSARSSLNSLKDFQCADSKLKQCTYSLISSQIIRKEEKAHLDTMFQMLDFDCDGEISGEDLQAVYSDRFGIELSEDDVDGIIYEVNLSGGGAITYSEYIIASLLGKGKLITNSNLELAFQMMDKDKSGYLTFDDLKDVLELGDDMEPYVRRTIIEPADLDEDGKISLEDFKAYFVGLDPASSSSENVLDPGFLRQLSKGSSTASRRSMRRSCRRSQSSARNSLRLSGLMKGPSDAEMAALRDEYNGNGSSFVGHNRLSHSGLEASFIVEPNFKNLMDIFETQINDNAEQGANTAPSMFQNNDDSGISC